jgi:hypothetical protein
MARGGVGRSLSGCGGSLGCSALLDAIPGGLRFVPFSFTLREAPGIIAMDTEKEQEIIRLWNRLRRLEREGRPADASADRLNRRSPSETVMQLDADTSSTAAWRNSPAVVRRYRVL